ncbi:cobalamin B12-binding domain-containing protein [Sphingomonas sanxanigenens]|uniref:B12-binding domain-containing protein n=1 Tax=Sphingomonas sanxanigenens DSM 19645 = NX02 TaxID=1123269 RepID=W0ABM6_9SPHN|nr:cobalamin-dependent protein [Sphingomonas sanxanigenens]AHE55334.1 hypothetical protein NX02_18325 [Sphingomonas sanxanigenens DSM 19645 = NX02]
MALTIRVDGHVAVNPPVPKRLPGFGLSIDADRARSLSAVIEGEIIPRLMVAHAAPLAAVVPIVSEPAISAVEIEEFAPLVLLVEADVLLVHVEAILARGVTFDTLLVELLAPTARMLGQYWEDDRYDFVDVTMGLWRLQEIVHEISGRLPPERIAGGEAHRALFAAVPGDQHSFGTVVIEELFRRHGWDTDRLCEVSTSELLKRAADCWFDVVGLTATCDCNIARLASIIAALRNVSRNPRVCIMVGGRIFSTKPDLAVEVGADATAPKADLALKIANQLVVDRDRGVAIR